MDDFGGLNRHETSACKETDQLLDNQGKLCSVAEFHPEFRFAFSFPLLWSLKVQPRKQATTTHNYAPKRDMQMTVLGLIGLCDLIVAFKWHQSKKTLNRR